MLVVVAGLGTMVAAVAAQAAVAQVALTA